MNQQLSSSEVNGVERALEELLMTGYSPRSMLDIGANVGAFAARFRRFFPACKMILVEPNPHCVDYLKNFEYEVAQIAASNENGTGTLFLTNEVLQSTGASLYRELTPHFSDDHLIRTEVKKARLDDYFEGRTFDFIKLDVQGSELDALRGGERIFRQADYVLIELSMIEYNEGEPPVEAVVDCMREMGLRLVDIVEYHRLKDTFGDNVIQIDGLFERAVPRATQNSFLGPYEDHKRLLSYLAQKRAACSDFTVIDVGAAANPWTANVIDATFDMNPCSVAKTHFTGNFNDRRAWQPLLDYVEKNGKFSYSICSHTLEDIANPSVVLDMLPLISERGYIATPSRFTEFLRHEGPYRGYIQHRWIFDYDDQDVILYPKLSVIEYMGTNDAHERSLMGDPSKKEFRSHWRKKISYRIINDDYMGPNPPAVVEMYAKLFSRLI